MKESYNAYRNYCGEKSYVSYIEIDSVTILVDSASPHTFTTPPVSVVDFVHVAVDRPRMEECVNNPPPGQDGYSRTNHPAVEIVAKGEDRSTLIPDQVIVTSRPEFLKEHKVILSVQQDLN